MIRWFIGCDVIRIPKCLTALLVTGVFLTCSADAYEATLTPHYNHGDGAYTNETRDGETVSVGGKYLYFDVPAAFPDSASHAYLKITYYDESVGPRISIQYDAVSNAYTQTKFSTRSSSIGINKFAVSYQRLDSPLFAGRQNASSDFRLNTGGGVPIKNIVIRDYPFEDPVAKHVLSLTPEWSAPYSGPTRDDVYAGTIKGKVVTGYQGWFRTPNDIYDAAGFRHWTVDMWPDPTDYPSSSLVAMPGKTTVSGLQGYVFSSGDFEVVHTHFKWMREHNIDGVYLQRFFRNANAGTEPEWVLGHVRKAAHLEGRVWAIEYDLSGAKDANLFSKIRDDWKWLVDNLKITDDSRYLHEDNKPVVVLWGAAIRANQSPASYNDLVDFLKNDPVYGGNYVVGCVSSTWPGSWDIHFSNYDSIFTWMGGFQGIADHAAEFGINSQVHVWPGFSWHNLKQLTFPTQYTDRDGGNFIWGRITDAIDIIDPEAIFIGMFDEYDEATAIMPMSDDPPNLSDPGDIHYITNDGLPKDWMMKLANQAKEMLTERVPYSNTLPTEASLANTSNMGKELTAKLGATNDNNLLEQVEVGGDGITTVTSVSGISCRRATNSYMYFNVDDSVLNSSSTGSDVTIIVDYLDAGGGIDIALEYDSVATAYKAHSKSFVCTGTNTWRSVRFEIDDAYFGNRQNGGCDFRLGSASPHHNMRISRVRVALPRER